MSEQDDFDDGVTRTETPGCTYPLCHEPECHEDNCEGSDVEHCIACPVHRPRAQHVTKV